ncbi:hypothetical protein C8F01DRAFT_972692 [Mycena amicta]|nr:hypothetical protein C8F01DRAFT_972692 [Mycena amicta]
MNSRRSKLPKAYSEPQLAFLRAHLPEFERRSHGPVRGDAKKFALERAAEFIARFGLPENVDLGQDTEARYKEQLYCWYKNTSGRNRRKAEGKPKSASPRKSTASTETQWEQYSENSSPTITFTEPTHLPVQYGTLPSSTLANALQPSPSPPPPPPPVTIPSLRDALLGNVDPSILACQIQTFVLANPGPLPLTPVLSALFQAISAEWDKSGSSPSASLTRFLAAAQHFPGGITHAGAVGPMAGARALHMQIRKTAKWLPSSMSASASGTSTMSAELQRITLDRARRKDHILWARIHASALDLGAFTFGYELQQQQQSSLSSSLSSHSTLSALSSHTSHGHSHIPHDIFTESRVFSELFAVDAVWEDDEVEWVAGALVLQALIRSYHIYIHTMAQGHGARIQHIRDKRRKYEDLLGRYEERWKEMKDETRQGIVTVSLYNLTKSRHRLDIGRPLGSQIRSGPVWTIVFVSLGFRAILSVLISFQIQVLHPLVQKRD